MTSAPRRARLLSIALVALVPLATVTACKPVAVVVDTFESIFHLGKNEIATPKFVVRNGITIQVVIKALDDQAGLPVVVRVRCAGGTELTQTVTLTESGDVSLGQTTFTQGWPAGADCIVSQEIVQGVEVVSKTLTWLDSTSLRANFTNL